MDQGDRQVEEMRERDLEPDLISHGAVIGNCEKGHRWSLVVQLMEEMQPGAVA